MIEKRELVEKIVAIANYDPQHYSFETKEAMIDAVLTDVYEPLGGNLNVDNLDRVIFFVNVLEHQALVDLTHLAESNRYEITMYGQADGNNEGWIEVFLIRTKTSGGLKE